MPAIPNPVLITTIFVSDVGGGGWSNVFYWSPAGSFTAANISTAAQDCYNLFAPPLSNCLHTANKVVACRAEYLNGATNFIGGFGGTTAGTVAGLAIGQQNAVCIRRLTGLTGRENRGRFFVSGLSASVFDPTEPDEIDPAQLAPFQALGALLVDQTFGGVICHSRHWNRKGNVLSPIVSVKVSSRVASRDDRRRHAVNTAV